MVVGYHLYIGARTWVRLERDRAERRQTREEEAEKKKAEHPALFEL